MAQKDDGGPAFPPTFGLSGDIGSGMTLRQWYAGQALAGLLAAGNGDDSASYAVFMADALIARLDE